MPVLHTYTHTYMCLYIYNIFIHFCVSIKYLPQWKLSYTCVVFLLLDTGTRGGHTPKQKYKKRFHYMVVLIHISKCRCFHKCRADTPWSFQGQGRVGHSHDDSFPSIVAFHQTWVSSSWNKKWIICHLLSVFSIANPRKIFSSSANN